MNDRSRKSCKSRKSHGKQLCLSSAKFRAVGSEPTLFIAKFRWTFVSKREFEEIALFVRRKLRSKSLELSFELSHGISKKVRENKNEIRAFCLRYFCTILYLTTNNSPSQDCTHLDNQTTDQMLTPFKLFTEYCWYYTPNSISQEISEIWLVDSITISA